MSADNVHASIQPSAFQNNTSAFGNTFLLNLSDLLIINGYMTKAIPIKLIFRSPTEWPQKKNAKLQMFK